MLNSSLKRRSHLQGRRVDLLSLYDLSLFTIRPVPLHNTKYKVSLFTKYEGILCAAAPEKIPILPNLRKNRRRNSQVMARRQASPIQATKSCRLQLFQNSHA